MRRIGGCCGGCDSPRRRDRTPSRPDAGGRSKIPATAMQPSDSSRRRRGAPAHRVALSPAGGGVHLRPPRPDLLCPSNALLPHLRTRLPPRPPRSPPAHTYPWAGQTYRGTDARWPGPASPAQGPDACRGRQGRGSLILPRAAGRGPRVSDPARPRRLAQGRDACRRPCAGPSEHAGRRGAALSAQRPARIRPAASARRARGGRSLRGRGAGALIRALISGRSVYKSPFICGSYVWRSRRRQRPAGGREEPLRGGLRRRIGLARFPHCDLGLSLNLRPHHSCNEACSAAGFSEACCMAGLTRAWDRPSQNGRAAPLKMAGRGDTPPAPAGRGLKTPGGGSPPGASIGSLKMGVPQPIY